MTERQESSVSFSGLAQLMTFQTRTGESIAGLVESEPVVYRDESDAVKVEKSNSVKEFVRRTTSHFFGIPSLFFGSQSEFRRWGEDEDSLKDPSVQPIPPGSVPPAKYFPSNLPGYPKENLPHLFQPMYFFKSPNCRGIPELTTPSSFLHPQAYDDESQFTPLFPSYNYLSNPSVTMKSQPYPNAVFSPICPSGMYGQCGSKIVAYPYGVPAVEENEGFFW